MLAENAYGNTHFCILGAFGKGCFWVNGSDILPDRDS